MKTQFIIRQAKGLLGQLREFLSWELSFFAQSVNACANASGLSSVTTSSNRSGDCSAGGGLFLRGEVRSVFDFVERERFGCVAADRHRIGCATDLGHATVAGSFSWGIPGESVGAVAGHGSAGGRARESVWHRNRQYTGGGGGRSAGATVRRRFELVR